MSEKTGMPPTTPDAGGVLSDAPPPYSAYPQLPPDNKQEVPLGFHPSEGHPAMQPGAPAPAVQVIHVATPATLAVVGPESVRVTCPHCQADMSTSLVKEPSIAAYVSAGLLFIFGCVCGCCLIPFCMDSCKTVEHRCTNCKKFIGRYSKF